MLSKPLPPYSDADQTSRALKLDVNFIVNFLGLLNRCANIWRFSRGETIYELLSHCVPSNSRVIDHSAPRYTANFTGIVRLFEFGTPP